MTQTTPYQRAEFRKPDGRFLWLYSRRPIAVQGPVPSPGNEPVRATPQQRWHPLRGEWVIYAAHRQDRTFLPPAEYNPLAPTHDPEHPTELPQGDYDIAVFQNRFPSLTLAAPEPDPVPGTVNRPGTGECEVVVFTQDAGTSLHQLPVEHVKLLVDVWADRTSALGEQDKIQYVLPFENRGVEVGVTLHHPHGQIYAYDHVPPVQTRALELAGAHLAEHGEPWAATFLREELESGQRLVSRNEGAVAVVPPFARYTYETWLLPARPAARLSDLSDAERLHFAALLKETLARLDALFGVRMPYLMTVHQAPTDGQAHEEWPLHIEIYPALRAKGKLKYLAGTEQGAGLFANDSLPEVKAKELREVTL
ncbi:galactose-1-phosphate uridylyltransferase [Deinococcus hopiensis]|uniref:Galactose-1-phosphate uridylyltransferase n=1 Tax=Deinococcus hopiensis KR-140 TaxID=695939 RepID=A0A1W1UGH9_9DEIO|nr:galactose-1-phosphate uridylyltransferase [Deinococcus hopiensis]SMB80205.1 UDPglucose--hexose-1-phosphate uridylyltransferase [Deinococcus hopiensis KR-140]